MSDSDTRRGKPRYRTLRVHSVLTRCNTERAPFRWTINPYRGCAFGCRYCYARYTHQWLDLDPDRGFEEDILVKRDFVAVLERDLKRFRHRGSVGEPIAVGTATDPYQPAEHRYGLTRGALERFAEERGHRLSITTKSDLVVRDIELLRRIAEHNCVRIHMSVTTVDRELARQLEPRAPSPRTRLSAIATLADAGVAVDAFVMPILPGLTDGEEQLDALFAAVAQAGARTAICETLFLRSPSREVFFSFLEREMPNELEPYRARYGDSAYAAPLYVERLRRRVDRLREKWGLLGARRHGWADAGALGRAPVAAPLRGSAGGRGTRSGTPARHSGAAGTLRRRRVPSLPRELPPGHHQLRLFEV